MSDPYERAKKKVKAKKGFYGHLGAYVATNTFMFFMVLFTGGGLGWLIPMGGWGIGLVSHYIGVFGWPGSGAGSPEWEEKEMQKELEKEGYDLKDFDQEEDELELREIKEVREERGEQKPWKDDDFV